MLGCLKILVCLAALGLYCEWRPRRAETGEEITTTLSIDAEEEQSASGLDEQLFTTSWATGFANGSEGCQHRRGSYVWRGAGFGSNINSE